MENPSGTVIHRVLNLRKQMEIDNELSTADPKDNIFFLSQTEASKHPMNNPYVYNDREWLSFGESLPSPRKKCAAYST
jgi:hypothetical protein